MKVNDLARKVREHLENDYDCVIAITSVSEGEGKSTLAKRLGMGIDDRYRLEKNVLFNPTIEQMKNLVLTLPKYSVIDADEAIKILYKLKWADKMSIFLNQLYALARSRNLATILCMPRYRDFTEFFRNHKIKFWIHIIERGTAIVMIKSWNPFAKDPWYLDENEKMIDQYIQKRKIYSFTTQEKVKSFEKCKNVIGVLEFDDLPEEIATRYKELRDKYKFDDLEIDGQTIEKLKLSGLVQQVLADPLLFGFRLKGNDPLVKLERIQRKFRISARDAALIKDEVEEWFLTHTQELELLLIKKKGQKEFNLQAPAAENASNVTL